MKSTLGFWLGITLGCAAGLNARQTMPKAPAAVIADGARDAAHPARMEQMEVPLHGEVTFGVFYGAAGGGMHPTVLLLHGFPGYEQNADLAQSIRRAGWNVLMFHYRGAWGSHGAFSFSHAMEDTMDMLAYMRTPSNAPRLGIDPGRIVVIGHSMGGFMAAYAGSRDTHLAGVVLLSAWNIGSDAAKVTSANEAANLADFRSNTGPLAGCTAESLLAEARKNAAAWNFTRFAPAMKNESVLVIDSDDGLQPDDAAMAQALRRAGDSRVAEIHFPTDHAYSDQRIALASTIVNWLAAR